MLPRMIRCSIALVVALTAVARGQVYAQLHEGVYRVDASIQARAEALPSLSFALPEQREAYRPLDDDGPVLRPRFSQEDGRQIIVIDIPAGTSLYATGEVPGRLLRNGMTNTNWNSDSYAYTIDTPSLYQSHPWVLGVLPDGRSFGVLADTTWRSTFDLRDGIRIEADGPPFPLILIEQESPIAVVRTLGELVGRIEMPPKWALGYHQCRYSYFPDDRVREIAGEFRKRDIPCDVIWMDIDYMDGYRCFTFSPEHFPDPAALNADLHAQGFHTVWMIDPGIKAEDGYFVYDQGTDLDAWVRRADGTVYQGEVWPGMCVFPDFTNATVRAWWAGLYEDFLATGIDGVWNDMNEPAIFNVPTKTMPEDNHHRADASLGGPGPHAQYHNVFGMLMIRATREGVMRVHPDRRPFVLSRANFIGGHRYGAAWTGDNIANWEHMEWSVPMTLNLALSGQPFAGPDIGGFIGNGGETEEDQGRLFARWMGFGAMLPFARGHTGKENRDKEPWAFGPEVEATCRRAIQRRYVLMPYLYTLFWQAHTRGDPVARPLFFADPRDPALRSEDDAFLLGGDLLVRPFMTPDRDRAVTMPRGAWRRFDFADRIEGDDSDPDLPELYLRPGAILPTGPVMEFVDEKPLDPLTLLVNLDERGRAIGVLYEDAGDDWGFRDGAYALSVYLAQREGDAVRLRRLTRLGSFDVPERRVRVIVLDDTGRHEAIGPDGAVIDVPLKP